MFFADVVNQEAMPALEKMLAYTQARQRMFAENIANIDNPHYRTKQLNTDEFQAALRDALDAKEASGADSLELAGDEFGTDGAGRLVVRPGLEPAENALFHDDTNTRIEQQMAMMAENAMMHQTMTELLRGKYDGIMQAIRGRVS